MDLAFPLLFLSLAIMTSEGQKLVVCVSSTVGHANLFFFVGGEGGGGAAKSRTTIFLIKQPLFYFILFVLRKILPNQYPG